MFERVSRIVVVVVVGVVGGCVGEQVVPEEPSTSTGRTDDPSTGWLPRVDVGVGSSTTGGPGSSSGGDPSSTGLPTSGSESGAVSDTETPPPTFCEAPGDPTPCDAETDDPFRAMGLGCEGHPNEVIPLVASSFVSADPAAWRIIRRYGSHLEPDTGLPQWRPREGEAMLALSTGRLPTLSPDGVLLQAPDDGGANGNPSGGLPPPITAVPGSNGGAGGTPFADCDGTGDCSDSLDTQWAIGGGATHDLLWFRFETAVPAGTHGYTFDFAYFSAEFPEYVGDLYNDMFVAWSDSESYTGNLCFVNDRPCTVTALWPTAYALGRPELEGTQFAGEVGEATGWYQAKGTAVPGERLGLTFALFDMGDDVLDTVVLLDAFAWDCAGCTPTEVDPCIGIDPI